MTVHQTTSRRRFLTALAAAGVATPFGLAACSGSSGSDSSSGGAGPVRITTADLPPAQTNPAGRAQFQADVDAFNTANKGSIELTAHEYTWASDTFAARLASGQLETTFLVPFTEPSKLIARRQVADITQPFQATADFADLNPQLVKVAQSDGKTYGVPVGGYAVGMVYNRAVFRRAGLDPDSPPTTWDEVRTQAKRIAALGGATSGFAMPTQDGYGGWYFTMMNASFGNQLERQDGSATTVTFPNGPSTQVMQLLHDMRWTDRSMGSKGVQAITDVQKQMAAGQLGMFTAAGDNLNAIVVQFGGKPADIGMGPYPQHGSADATLTGGSTAMFNVRADSRQLAAAAKWVDFHYLRQYSDAATAKQQFAAIAKDKTQTIGYPTLPLFTGARESTWEAIRAQYADLPAANFTAFNDWISSATLQPEPAVEAQVVYQALDAAVQKILTDSGADIGAALTAAAGQVKPALASAGAR